VKRAELADWEGKLGQPRVLCLESSRQTDRKVTSTLANAYQDMKPLIRVRWLPSGILPRWLGAVGL